MSWRSRAMFSSNFFKKLMSSVKSMVSRIQWILKKSWLGQWLDALQLPVLLRAEAEEVLNMHLIRASTWHLQWGSAAREFDSRSIRSARLSKILSAELEVETGDH